MSETTKYYIMIDSDGDEIKLKHIVRTCRCSCSTCVDDSLNVFDEWTDESSYHLNITGENKYAIYTLLEIAEEAGKLIEVKPYEDTTKTSS